MKKVTIFSYNFVMLAGVGFMTPFIVLYYQSLGFSGLQIGLLTGLSPLVLFVSTPILTSFVDAHQRHRVMLTISLTVLALIVFVFPLVSNFALVLGLIIFLNIIFAPANPIADSAMLYMLADEPELYSRMRVGGTIGFGLAITISGFMVEAYGLIVAFWGGALLFVLAMLVSQRFHFNPTKSKTSTQANLRVLLRDRYWIRFLGIAFLGGVSLSISSNYFFSYLEELGTSKSMMGLALSIGTIIEIPALFYGNRLLKAMGSYRLLLVAMVLMAVRMILLGIVDTPFLALAIQVLAGITFPIVWIAGVAYAHEHTPEGMSATGQGLFGAMILGIGAAVGGLTGGLLLDLGTRNLFLVSGIVILIALGLLSVMKEQPHHTREVLES